MVVEEVSIFKKLLEFENKIINSKDDDEKQHILEDNAMKFFIENAHRLSKEEIISCQTVFRRIEIMDFSRWHA